MAHPSCHYDGSMVVVGGRNGRGQLLLEYNICVTIVGAFSHDSRGSSHYHGLTIRNPTPKYCISGSIISTHNSILDAIRNQLLVATPYERSLPAMSMVHNRLSLSLAAKPRGCSLFQPRGCSLFHCLQKKCEGELSDSNPRTFGSNPQFWSQ